MKTLYALGLGLFLPLLAQSADCEQTAKGLIESGYNEGDLKLTSLQGPFKFNEPFFDAQGNRGLKHRIVFAVSYAETGTAGQEIRIADCVEGEPSSMLDADDNGVVNLSDMLRAKK